MSIGRAPPSAARGHVSRGPGEACGAGGPPPDACHTAPEPRGPAVRANLDDPQGGLNLLSGLLGAELAHPLKPPLVVTGSFAHIGIRV